MKERYSGLWEFFYDSDVEEGRGGGGEGVEEEDENMKNIRGFLFKRRKSPLKGWHKVRQCTDFWRECHLLFCPICSG